MRVSETKTIKANALWMLAAELCAKLATLVLVVLFARRLSQEIFGYFNFAITFVPMLLVIGRGIDFLFMRDLARDPRRLSTLFTNALTLRLCLGVIALFVSLAAGGLFLGRHAPLAAFALIAIALLVDEVAVLLGSTFIALEQPRFNTLITVVNRVTSTIFVAVALVAGTSFAGLAGMYLLGSLAGLLFAVYIFRRVLPPVQLRWERPELSQRLLRDLANLGLGNILGLGVFRIDVTMLQFFRGPASVAVYSVVYRLLDSTLFVSWALTDLAVPRMAQARGRQLARILQLASSALLSFYLLAFVCAVFGGRWILVTLFSDRYEAAAAGAAPLVAAGIFYSLAHLGRRAAISIGRTSPVFWFAGILLLFNVAINVAVIPRYGYLGAAWTTLATEILDALLFFTLLLRERIGRVYGRQVAVPIVATIVTMMTLWVAGTRGAPALAAALILYGSSWLLAARILIPHGFQTLRQALSRSPDEVPAR